MDVGCLRLVPGAAGPAAVSVAFDGEGARLFGGRWSSPGVPVVYVASTRSLAALEMMRGARAAQSAGLAVPSAILKEETNFLLNPVPTPGDEGLTAAHPT